jgi:hypothetical protein
MPKAYKALPPASELWELFDYKPLTGELFYREHAQKRFSWKRAGGKDAKGYERVKIKDSFFKTQRLIWAWVTSNDPGTLNVDHINGDAADNCWSNLRLATDQQNAANRPGRGYRYLYREGRTKNWLVVFVHKGKTVLGKYYLTEAEAAKAAIELKKECLGEWRRV